jgi:NAD-dependent deacetylase
VEADKRADAAGKRYGRVGPASDGLEVAAGLVRRARAICVLTGAGISTESGIPDFRGPDGLWTSNPAAARLSSLAHYLSGPEVRVETWRRRVQQPFSPAEPNPGHLALVELERRGQLELLVTQNIDGLHLRAGTSPERLVEIHGSLREYLCLKCGRKGPMAEVLERVRHGEADPACLACGGILKSAAISFGQKLPTGEVQRAERAARRCDLFLAVGTSLQVFPVAELPAIALAEGASLVVVNAEPTPYDRRAVAVVRGRIGELLPIMVGGAPPG